MALFKNEKLENINKKIEDIQAKIETFQARVEEDNRSFSELYEKFVLDEVKGSEVKKAKKMVEKNQDELLTLKNMLQKLKDVKRKVAFESVPFVKEAKAKKLAKIQDEYDKKVLDVHEARSVFLSELQVLGQIKNEIYSVDFEYNKAMEEAGEKTSVYSSSIRQIVVIPSGYTTEADALGITEQRQKITYQG